MSKAHEPMVIPVKSLVIYGALFLGVVCFFCLVIHVLTNLHPSHPRIQSQNKMSLILRVIHIYATDYDEWPEDLVVAMQYHTQSSDEDILTNPRDGYLGYAYEKPTFEYDDPEGIASTTPILFEVCEHGALLRDSGLIGYADGHVEYVQEDE